MKPGMMCPECAVVEGMDGMVRAVGLDDFSFPEAARIVVCGALRLMFSRGTIGMK